MNHIYRLVWSKSRRMLVAVAEICVSRTKGGTRRQRQGIRLPALAPLSCALFIALGMAPSLALALPSGGQVVAGQADIGHTAHTMTVNQQTAKAIINWQSFGIGSDETVTFQQPGVNSVALNRVLGSNASAIYGHLNANGQVFLVNPNGVYFAPGSQVNVGGLVASTLEISNRDFLNGHDRFSGNSTAGVRNAGAIDAVTGGYVALIGPRVSNDGSIATPGGETALGAGSRVDLQLAGDRLLRFAVSGTALNAEARNGGVISSDGGRVMLTADAKDALLTTVVNNTGLIRAQTVKDVGGTIELLGGQSGTVQVAGTLDASAPNGGNGGRIETSGAHLKVDSHAVISTHADDGTEGNWLIDPNNFTIAASGGDITGSALSTALSKSSVTIKTSSTNASCSGTSITCTTGTSGNGDILVNDTVSWSANTLTLSAYRDIVINTAMNASGSAKLALLYGQGSTNGVINSVASSYTIGAPVNLEAGAASTGVFSTRLGSGGSVIKYTVITSLGAQGDATTAPGTMTLQGIATALGGDYVLGAKIDASPTSGWNTNQGFVPLGNTTTAFSGIFDGLGHIITGLYINRSNTSIVGLFGEVSGGTVRNIGLESVSVTAGHQAGDLVGLNVNGSISNAYATGSVTADNSGTIIGGFEYVGGLVGANVGGTISHAYAAGDDNGIYNVGGLVGLNSSNGTISDSYATGVVSGSYEVGGLVGLNRSNAAISNAYATGAVSGSSGTVGGLVGYNFGTISNAYATGNVSGSSNVGGLVGSSNGGTISDGNWDTDTSGTTTGTGSGGTAATGETTAQLQGSLPSGFSSKVWGTATGLYPYFRWQYPSTPQKVAGIAYSDAGKTVLAAESVSLLIDGNSLGSVSSGANGYYYTLVPAGTITSSGSAVLASTSTGAAVTSATGSVSTLDIYGGVLLLNPTSASTLSSAKAAMTSLVKKAVGTNTDPTTGITGQGYIASSAGFTVDQAVNGSLYVKTTASKADITIASAQTLADNDYLVLNAGGNILFNATVSVTGKGAVSLTTGGADSFSGGSLDFGTTSNGATLSINGTAYTLLYSLGATGSTTGTDLQGISGNLSGHYALATNIDASATSGWNSGRGFAPLGNATTKFTGIFDGLNHTISKLTINRSGTNDVGLFGVSSGTIRNVSLVSDSVSGKQTVGGLVGSSTGGTISNAYVTGTVSGSSSNVGGLVGSSSNGTISNAHATGTVSGGYSNLGGLVGGNSGGTISESYATGTVNETGMGQSIGGLVGNNSNGGAIKDSYVTATVVGNSASDDVGGLVGYNANGTISNSYATGTVSAGKVYGVGGLVGSNRGTISNTYATGSATGTGRVGGLVGVNNGGTISKSYATGKVSITTSSNGIGGLVGSNSSGTLTSNYWDTQTSGTANGVHNANLSGVTDKTTAGLAALVGATSSGFLSSVWGNTGGQTTPYLLADARFSTVSGHVILSTDSSATPNYYDVILNVTQLQDINTTGLSGDYVLGQNIDASATSGWNSNGSGDYEGFAPLGNATTNFSGIFDGLGYTISNLTISRSGTNNVGLFGANSGTISNVGLVSDNVTGKQTVGGLVGSSSNGTISNAYATGTVSGTFSNVGGLVGSNNKGTIKGSYAATTVEESSGGQSVGGLVGSNRGTISNAYATGTVSAATADYVGGLAGINRSTISDSYATGTVTAKAGVGGLVGWNGSGHITDSFATGNVSGTNGVGGLIGSNSSGTITGGYWDTTVTGKSLPGVAGGTNTGATGKTTAGLAALVGATGSGFTTSVWGNAGGQTTPYLLADAKSSTVSGHVILSTDTSATPTYYDVILNVSQLQDINTTGLSGDYVLGQNMDASATSGWNTNKGFAPLGNATTNFSGVFNGLGYIISNLTINRPKTKYIGLFGDVGSAGKISHVGLVGGSVSGGNGASNNFLSGETLTQYTASLKGGYVGGLAGYSAGTISESFTSLSVSGANGTDGGTDFLTQWLHGSRGGYVGGLVGYNTGSISHVHASGSVAGASGGSVVYSGSATSSSNAPNGGAGGDLGGLVGYNAGTISGAYATGAIAAGVGGDAGAGRQKSYVSGIGGMAGGLVGNNAGTINDAYASGSVTGGTGGNGANGFGTNFSINSAPYGAVGGHGGDAGGLVGSNSGTVKDSYATGSVVAGAGGNGGGSTSNDPAGAGGAGGDAGGLVGDGTGTISDAYATGSVNAGAGGKGGNASGAFGYSNGTGGAGGNGGGLMGNGSGTINASYSTGATSGGTGGAAGLPQRPTGYNFPGANGKLGGLLGSFSGTVSNSYWDTTTSGTKVSAGIGGGTTTGVTGETTATLSSNLPSGFSSSTWGNVGNQMTPYLLANANYGAVGGHVILSTDTSATPTYYDVILNVTQLQDINTTGLSGDYVLGQNIDASATSGWNSNKGFAPLGSATANFSGVLDGAGHTISNLTISRSGTGNVGLFGSSSGMIRNVGLVNGSVTGNYTVGSLVGSNKGTISNAHATGTVSAGSNFVGGLVGINNNNGTIKASDAGVTVTVKGSNEYIGGLVGLNYGTIGNTYATGTVSAGGTAGDVGGLIGSNDGTISHSYAAGKVSSTTSSNGIGGLAGAGAGTFTGDYWDTTTSGRTTGVGHSASTAGVTGLATTAWLTEGPMATGTFSTTTWATGYPYPVLKALPYVVVQAAPATRTYGSNTPALTISGLVDQNGNDASSIVNTTSATLFTVPAATSVGTYAIGGRGATLNSGYSGYQITYTGSVKITPKQLTASIVNDPTKVYDGTNTATLAASNYQVTGFVGSQGATFTTPSKGSYATSNASNTDTVTTVLSAGDFKANTGTSFSNYILPTSASGKGTISQAPITVSIINKPTKTYDGTTAETLGASNFSVSGFVGSQGATFTSPTTGSYASANAGSSDTVTATLSASEFKANTGTSFSNYILPTSASGAGTINAKSLTVSMIGTPTKTYDGTKAATLGTNNFSLSGFITGQGATVSQTSGTYASSNAGTSIAVNATLTSSSYQANSGTSLSNYVLPTGTVSGTGSINARPLSVSLIGNPTKTYDGTKVATLASSNYQLTGFVSGQGATFTPPTTGSYASANAARSDTVTATLTAGDFKANTGTSFNNYVLPTSAGGAGTIMPKHLTASIVNDPTKTYDGTTAATLGASNFSLSGFITGQGATVTPPTTGSYASANAARSDTVTATLTAGDFKANTGTSFSNYTLPASASGAGTIMPKHLTASIVNDPTKTYDGTTAATLGTGNFSVDGFVAGQGATISQTTGSYASANAGTGISVTANLAMSDYHASSGTLLSNYVLATGIISGHGNIDALPVTLTGTRTYDGTAGIAGSLLSASNLISGDRLTITGSATLASRNAGKEAIADFSGLGLSNDNYTLYDASGSVTVTPKVLTVTGLTVANKTFDGTTLATVSNYGSLSGVVQGDPVSLDTANVRAAFADPFVGQAIPVTVSGLALTNSNGDYTLAATLLSSANILFTNTISAIGPAQNVLEWLSGSGQQNAQFTSLTASTLERLMSALRSVSGSAGSRGGTGSSGTMVNGGSSGFAGRTGSAGQYVSQRSHRSVRPYSLTNVLVQLEYGGVACHCVKM